MRFEEATDSDCPGPRALLLGSTFGLGFGGFGVGIQGLLGLRSKVRGSAVVAV